MVDHQAKHVSCGYFDMNPLEKKTKGKVIYKVY